MIDALMNRLSKREEKGNKRYLKLTNDLIDFASNDYLGLARSQNLAKIIFEEINQQKDLHGFGSTGSRLLTGHFSYQEKLEQYIAQSHQCEAALLFNCGYMANIGLLSSIASSKDIIFFDANVHPSTKDGIRLSKGTVYPFKHQDLRHLESRLKSSYSYQNRFICIESVYSTDGTVAPLQAINKLAKKYQAHLIVDEAHAIGIYGPEGKGFVAEAKLTNDIFAQIVTFGKALGVHGAAILGGKILKDYLINFAHSFIYTTALPLNTLAAIKCSYDYFPKCESQRSCLQELITLFKSEEQTCSDTAIQTIKIKGNEQAKLWVSRLSEEGFDVRAFLSPTVRKGHEIIRICLHAFNTQKQLKSLIQSLKNLREN